MGNSKGTCWNIRRLRTRKKPDGTYMGTENMVSKYAMKTQRAIYEKRYTLDVSETAKLNTIPHGDLNKEITKIVFYKVCHLHNTFFCISVSLQL